MIPQMMQFGSILQQQMQYMPIPRPRCRLTQPVAQIQAQLPTPIIAPDSTFIFTQLIPSAIWTINHNLAQYPSVTLVDLTGKIVMAQVQYISNNQIVVTFSQPFAGKAYLNV
jgi:hypothetical protein